VPAPYALGLVGATALLLFIIRFTGPPDLADNFHQERQASYVLDILENGHWACQRDPYGEIASKPPLHAWLSAVASIVCSGFSWFTLVLPGAIAAAGTAFLLLRAGRRYFAPLGGLFAALFFLISPVGLRQIVQGRIDGLFAFTSTVAALLAFNAWQSGRGWTWFWLAVAVATLAKGPLGLLLGGIGLVAAVWEKRGGTGHRLCGRQWPGVLIWLLISAGWVFLAYRQFGQPMLDKVLGRELVGHAVIGRSGTLSPLGEFYLPTVNFLARFAPWSILTCLGLWRVCRRPSSEEWTRRFERFVFCWFVGGVLIFSVAAHQRPDLIYPVIPPAALLAGGELAYHFRRLSQTAIARMAFILIVLGLIATVTQYHWLRRNHKLVKRTAAARSVVEFIHRNVGLHFPLVHVNEDYAVQAYLGTMVPYVSSNRASELLAGDAAVFALVQKPAFLLPTTGTNWPQVLFQTPGPDGISLISNHPRLESVTRVAFDLGEVEVQIRNARIHRASLYQLTLQRTGAASGVTILNRSRSPRSFRVRWIDGGTDGSRVLSPGERWTVDSTAIR
jgi:hypothetical protein